VIKARSWLPNNVCVCVCVCVCVRVRVWVCKFEFIYKFELFQFQIARHILSDFQRNPKSKLIEIITNNIHD